MKHFYTALLVEFEKESNKDLYRSTGISPIKHIDLYVGQDQIPELKEVYQLPALFVSWSINYERDKAIAVIDCHIAYEQLRDTSNYSKNRIEALKCFDVVEMTDKIIKSTKSNDTSALALKSEGLDMSPTAVDVFTLSYECLYFGKKRHKKPDQKVGQITTLNTFKATLKSDLTSGFYQNSYNDHLVRYLEYHRQNPLGMYMRLRKYHLTLS